jgi:hypothetical protein
MSYLTMPTFATFTKTWIKTHRAEGGNRLNGRTHILREKPLPLTHSSPQIPPSLTWNQTWVLAVRNHRLNGRAFTWVQNIFKLTRKFFIPQTYTFANLGRIVE